MEKFKAVEKAMKTKAYSKEGLSAAAKLDPKEQAKAEASEFLSSQVDELEQQIELLEAESESIQATMKKGKSQSAKADRVAEIERIIERHKWHQGKLELIRRSLDNGGVEAEQVTDLEESIRYYVTDGMQDDFMEDDTMYDDLNLHEDEDAFGVPGENDKLSSQDAQSIQDEPLDEGRSGSVSSTKPRTAADNVSVSSGRRPSAQLKSPLPTLATLHGPLQNITNGASSNNAAMKPASLPTRPAGEGLKYASAAAAAAASDKNNVGIAPLPPPPALSAPGGISPLPSTQLKTSAMSSPSTTSVLPATSSGPPAPEQKPSSTPGPSASTLTPSSTKAEAVKPASSRPTGKAPIAPEQTVPPKGRHLYIYTP